MTVTIGRASLTDIFDVRLSGRRLTFTTDIEAASADEMKAIRQQLAGLVDNRDEEAIPFTWSEDSSLNGYYRVVSVNVPSTEVMLTSGFVPDVEVELEQVPGYANPWFEVTTQSVVRSNVHSVTTPSGVFAAFQAPSADVEFELSTPIRGLGAPTTVTLDTGDAMKIYKATAPVALTSFRFSCSPGKFYAGSCVVEQKVGSTWYPLVGRQTRIPAGTPWRLSNGLVRLTSIDGAAGGKIEVYNGTQWEAQSIQYGYNTAGTLVRGGHIGQAPVAATTVSVTVLRNSPEHVVIRTAGADEVVSWSLQRGAFLFTYVSNVTSQTGLVYSTNTGITGTYAGEFHRTTADASGNGLSFLYSSILVAFDTTMGGMYDVYGTASGVGLTIDSATALSSRDRRDEFLAPAMIAQRVIAR